MSVTGSVSRANPTRYESGNVTTDNGLASAETADERPKALSAPVGVHHLAASTAASANGSRNCQGGFIPLGFGTASRCTTTSTCPVEAIIDDPSPADSSGSEGSQTDAGPRRIAAGRRANTFSTSVQATSADAVSGCPSISRRIINVADERGGNASTVKNYKDDHSCNGRRDSPVNEHISGAVTYTVGHLSHPLKQLFRLKRQNPFR